MKWFRQKIRQHRTSFLALLAINVFFIADALETTVEIQSQLLHETWDAAGYVLEDPATGAGGYFRDL